MDGQRTTNDRRRTVNNSPQLSIAISRMTLADIPAVMAIERESFPMPWPAEAYRHEIEANAKAYFVVAHTPLFAESPSNHRVKMNMFQWLLARNRPSSVVGRPSSVVGYAGMWNFADEAHIATIASHPQWRGRGVGEWLLIHLLREALRQNAFCATLEVRVSNVAAQCLYKKYGFEEVGRRKAYYNNNREDALIYTITNFRTAAFAQQLRELEAALQPKRMP